MDETVEVTDGVLADGESDRPAVTHDEYLELVSMRQTVLELKAQKADVLEFVNVAQQYASQLQGASERLGLINDAITENSEALQERMKEIVEPFNISGEFSISDTEPHFIVSAS